MRVGGRGNVLVGTLNKATSFATIGAPFHMIRTRKLRPIPKKNKKAKYTQAGAAHHRVGPEV